jgi:ATP-dependent protease HslVU (ClpYQ) ATPase subunit
VERRVGEDHIETTIDANYVSKHLDALVADEDLSRFIL